MKIGQHCNRLRVAYIHYDTTLINNEPLKIYVHRHKIRKKIKKQQKKNNNNKKRSNLKARDTST